VTSAYVKVLRGAAWTNGQSLTAAVIVARNITVTFFDRSQGKFPAWRNIEMP
jgi:hypothetical protein